MRFVIRADATKQSGAGHVMRCSAIAEELMGRGLKVEFVGSTEELPWVEKRLRALGLKGFHRDASTLVVDPTTDVLILDSYSIPTNDLFIKESNWLRVIVLVDDATPKYHGRLYIHCGPETSWLPDSSKVSIRFLSGIEYLPIRESLRKIRKESKEETPTIVTVAVIGGGSDPFDFCTAILTILKELPENFVATFFMDNPPLALSDKRFRFQKLGIELETFLNYNDVIFTTAGTSSWEFLSCGFPLGIGCAADNQIANYEFLTKNHLAVGVGTHTQASAWEIDRNKVQSLLIDSTNRDLMGRRGIEIVDGYGSKRVVDAILAELV
jgi:spore coat polysaccharide biosynthesis predicted glycosyltransferase SpsG